MIQPELMRDKGIVIVQPEGKLEKVDFEQLANLVDPYIQEQGNLNGLMVYATDFSGWEDMASMVSHFQFIEDHHEKVKKVAVVTDDNVLSLLPSIGNHFTSAEVKHFPVKDREQAESWLEK